MGKLKLRLPHAKPGEFFQLLHLDKIGKHGDDWNNISITTYFQKKDYNEIIPHFLDEPIERRIKLGYIRELQVGSLWDMEGTRVWDSEKVITARANIVIGTTAYEILPLKEVFTWFSSISNIMSEQLWRKIAETPYLVIDGKKTRFLLPCVEILKYFFYKGPKIVELLCSQYDINSVIEISEPPTVRNSFTAVSSFHQSRFSNSPAFNKDELRVLVELAMNKSFKRNVYSSYSKLTCSWNRLYLRQVAEPRAYIENDGLIGKDIKLKVGGTYIENHFQQNRKPIFIVSNILFCQNNPFSYKYLLTRLPTSLSKNQYLFLSSQW